VGRARFGYLVGLVCAVAFTLPAAGSAHHNADAHNAMRIDWSFPMAEARTHSDIAMWGNIVVSGNYTGFRIFDISRPMDERLRVSFLCRGPQNDVSLWEHDGQMLLFMSIDSPQFHGDTVCGSSSASDRSVADPEGWEGIRIFDITDPTAPVFLKGVRTNCGSHTHTLIPDLPNNRLLLYATTAASSGGPYCQIPHNRIPIVTVPLDAPQTASVLSEPRLISSLRGCHDITVFLPSNLAAAACESEGQFWDITDPANPGTTAPLARIDDARVNYWHSAEFTWDGQYVVFDDETFVSDGCNSSSTGRVWFYRVSDRQQLANFKTRQQPTANYCGAHNGNIIPVVGKYLLVMSWYGGGTSVIDFTNPAAPTEIGYYTAVEGRGPADTWSSYWYNGRIYANDITRGTDVFNVILPWAPYGASVGHLNAQTQEFSLPPPFASMTPVARLKPQRLLRKLRPGGLARPAGVTVKRLTARGPA
jgi:hypothetical protein